MKLNKIATIGFIIALSIAIASLGITVYAAVTDVWSPSVSVTVSDTYTLTLTDPADGNLSTTYIFTGVLNKNGLAQIGKTVTLYISADGTTYSSTGTSTTTDGAGGYSISWTPTTAGTFQFKAFYNSAT